MTVGSLTCTFQIWTHLSKEPLAKYLPSGLNATLYTGSWCFVNVWIHVPRSTSHNLTVESKEALQKKYNMNHIYIYIYIYIYIHIPILPSENVKKLVINFCPLAH